MIAVQHPAVQRWCRAKALLAVVVCLVWAATTFSGSPSEALQRMKVADGFEVKLYASEPDIRQPVTMTFDERGRMWVIQYLQYPTPAGLRAVKVDQYLRTKYDKVPEPPPRGPKGADRITICEDTDGDGRADKFRDFVTGLNLASGLALGYGGAFVAQPPYLLFYPDRDRDDAPDGDPEVLLTGFGMEDSHAFANSLVWGPDGWLYGAHGSTVTANIRGVEFQQGIWRYHPITKAFELFAEGGGNTWGLDFDEHGNIIAGTNFGDKIALHQVQGAYYVKGFAKHGPLHNLHTYGYFEHIPYAGFKGGHVTCGGIVYQGNAFPEKFRGAYIAANLLANAVYWHVLEPDGSSFKGRFGGALIETDDVTFRPVDCEVGPDGSVFIADWCDKRATHVDSLDTWDRSNGRIYKLEAKGSARASRAPAGGPPARSLDLTQLPSEELIKLLSHPNGWFVRAARRLLAERRDATVIRALHKTIFDTKDDQLAVESLWALCVSGAFDDAMVEKLLQHRNEYVRSWTIRLLGDRWKPTAPFGSPELISPLAVSKDTGIAVMPGQTLIEIARVDSSSVVRNQLACSAKRMPAKAALPIIRELLQRSEDVSDPQIPLLIWWAIESKAIPDREQVVELTASAAMWKQPLVQQYVVERLARRYAAEGTDKDFETCARLLSLAPTTADADRVLRGIDLALAGRRLEKAPPALEAWFAKAWERDAARLSLVGLGLRIGDERAKAEALRLVANDSLSENEGAALMEVLGQAGVDASAPSLLGVLEKSKSATLQAAALSALQHFGQPSIARKIAELYPQASQGIRQRMRSALCARPSWAAELLNAVEAGRIDPKDITLEQVRQLASLKDDALARRVEKRWGKVQFASDEEKQNTINQLRLVLHPSGAAGRQGKGDPVAGKQLFLQNCGVCHKLFGEGNEIGPDLTGADRKNTELMLLGIVTPNAYIRPEYVNYEVQTRDDQTISGLMVEPTPAAITILDRNNQRHVLSREVVKELKESELSLMPEGLLEALKPEQIMDLFSYLQGDAPISRANDAK